MGNGCTQSRLARVALHLWRCAAFLVLSQVLLAMPSPAETVKEKDTLDRALGALAMKRSDLTMRPDLSPNPYAFRRFTRWMGNPQDAPREAQDTALRLLKAAGDPASWTAELASCGDMDAVRPLPPVEWQEPAIPPQAPPPLRKALLILMKAVHTANKSLGPMQAGIPPESMRRIEDALYPDWLCGGASSGRRKVVLPAKEIREALRLAGTVDRKTIVEAALTLVAALKRAAEILTAPEMREIQVSSFSFTTEIGLIRVGGRGPDTHEEEAALIIDLGGNDLYRGRVASGRDGRCSLLLDLEGDDTYTGEDLTQGSGFWGIGVLADLEGDDLYKAGNGSQGAGLFGLGLLIDGQGSDRYLGGQFVQAASSWGWGGLIDLSGEDLYQCDSSGQAFSAVLGISCLTDRSGNDRYLSGRSVPDPREPGMSQSMSQGFSMGMRNLAAGGFSLLAEGGGNDFYQGHYFCQGASYWMGTGVLYDHEGHDTYLARRYAQGAGIHFSMGMLLDAGGNDHTCSWGVSQGCGHDYGVGLLVNRTGNDTYVSDWLSMGASEANGIGIFVDCGGEDGYDTRTGMGVGHLTEQRRAGGIGIFMDIGGRDRYAGKGAENALWAETRFGVGVDDSEGRLSAFCLSPADGAGPESDRIGHKRAEEGERLRERLAKAPQLPCPERVEILLSVTSHWGLEQDIPRQAKEELLRLDPLVSVPAMIRLLDTPDVMALHFMEEFFVVQAFHALPHLIEKAQDPDPAIQRAALHLLALLKDTRAVECSIQALHSRDWRVRAAAIRTMGEMLDRERLGGLIPIHRVLTQARQDGNTQPVDDYLQKDTLPLLLSVLLRSSPVEYGHYRQWTGDQPGHRDGKAREEMIRLVAGRLGDMIFLTERWIRDIQGSEETARQMLKCVQDTDPAVRRAAAYALGQMRFRSALGEIASLLQDQDRWVRDSAVLSLSLFGDDALPHIEEVMRSGESGPMTLALDALSKMKTHASRVLIQRAVSHPEEEVRRAARRGLSSP